MMRQIAVLLLSLCTLCGAASAQPTGKEAARKQKPGKEIRQFEKLRNDAVIKFAKENPPQEVIINVPGTDVVVKNIICAADNATRKAILSMEVSYTISHNGNIPFRQQDENDRQCVARIGSQSRESRYALMDGTPRRVLATIYDLPGDTQRIDEVRIALDKENSITLKLLPVYWTDSDKTISRYVRNEIKDKK